MMWRIVSDETFERACNGIFAEPPVDVLWKEEAPVGSGDSLFSVEFLPGQFDQRADSAVQCIQFVKEDEQPVIRTATTYIIHGKNGAITEEELQKIKEHCINPVDSREAAEEKPETLVTKFDEPADVIVFDGFKDMEEEELKKLYDSLGLAMTFRDFQHYPESFQRGRAPRSFHDRDPRTGYLLVRPLPSYNIFNRTYRSFLWRRRLSKTDGRYLQAVPSRSQ